MRMTMTKAAAGGGLAITGLLNDLSISLFNVPLTVVFMAFAGAMLSFAYNIEGDEKISRRKFYGLIVANTIFACAAVAVIPQWLGWVWASPKIEGSLALLFAAIARFIVPLLLKFLPDILKRLTKIGEYKQNQDSYGGYSDGPIRYEEPVDHKDHSDEQK